MSVPVEARLAPALAALGLRPDADARAVRRAYALQLKQIDQATQLPEFQALREAYEAALAGLAWREAQAREQAQAVVEPPPPRPPDDACADATAAASAPVPPPSAAAALPPLPSPAALAEAVFQAFAARAAAGFTSEDEATAALNEALADERLLNLESRTGFEWHVAHLIMGGWQPGHECLFDPACQLFGWEKDRAHLRIFGQLGAALDAAINEKLIFFLQEPHLQLDVLRRLRGTDMPSIAQRRTDLVLVQTMVHRYPNWLRLVTSQANINAWFQDLPEPEPAPAMATAAAPAPAGRPRRWLPWLGWILALLVVIVGLSRPSHQPPPARGAPIPPWASVTPTPATRQPANPWPDSVLNPSTGTQFGSIPTVQAPLHGKLPPPSRAPADPPATADQPAPAGTQFAFLGNVSFNRTGDQIVVDEVDAGSPRGRSTLKPGDQVQGCPTIDKRVPFAHALESSACGTVRRVDAKTGIVTYVFRVMRRGQSTTALLVMPPPQGQAGTAANAAAIEEALKAGATLPMPPAAPRPVLRPTMEATVQLGHVTFKRQDSAVVVAQVGERTPRSFGTLQPGDTVLGCMAGNYHLPLTHPGEVRLCLVSNPPPSDASTTPYMFRILRAGQSKSQAASLTLRQPGDGPAPSPAASLPLGAAR